MSDSRSVLDLLKERVVFLDGAMGSMLIDLGLHAGEPPESWNVTQPKKIQQVHSSYFGAGSDIVLANTFGASRLKLKAHGHEQKIAEYNSRAVEIARAVCPEHCFIAADIGPSGQFLPPVGKGTIEMFHENFLEQATILSESGIDLFFVETMVDIREAEAAVKAIRKVSKKPIMASVTFKKTKRGFYTIMGDSIEKCVKTLENAGVNVLGANCTIGSSEMIELVPLLVKETALPILVKPNAGQPELQGGKTVYKSSPAEFSNDILMMVKQGARVVGGCCGTNPEYIQKMVQKVKAEDENLS